MTHTLQLAPQAASVSAGRAFVARCLDDLGASDLADTAVLLTSELVTNSVLHARTEIKLSLSLIGDDAVEICVSDGSRHSPRRRDHAKDATTGRGLELLERLAHSWEVVVDAAGKTIRFVLVRGTNPWAAFDPAMFDAEL